MALDQLLGFAPMGQRNINRTIDTYMTGTAALYTGENIIPSYGNNIIPYGNITGEGGDVHDTFKIDRYDNLYGGHTTIRMPGYKPLHLDWDSED